MMFKTVHFVCSSCSIPSSKNASVDCSTEERFFVNSVKKQILDADNKEVLLIVDNASEHTCVDILEKLYKLVIMFLAANIMPLIQPTEGVTETLRKG